MVVWGYDIRVYFLLFMIYSVLGWTMEVTCKLIQYKRFINRGFLIGPYCPIYGCGGILITVLLNRYMSDPFVLFVMAILLCGTLEYLTSYFMDLVLPLPGLLLPKKISERWRTRDWNSKWMVCSCREMISIGRLLLPEV